MIELNEKEVEEVSGAACPACWFVHDHPHPEDNMYGDIEAMLNEEDMF